jgi:hypothetical protein
MFAGLGILKTKIPFWLSTLHVHGLLKSIAGTENPVERETPENEEADLEGKE